MILLKHVNWEQFKKIIQLCDGDSDMGIFESTLLNGVGRFMFNSELDSNYDEFIFAYCRVDGVIEWNINDDCNNDQNVNELMLWDGLLGGLLKNYIHNKTCLTVGDIMELNKIHQQLKNQIPPIKNCFMCGTHDNVSFHPD